MGGACREKTCGCCIVVRRVDWSDGSQITRGRGRPRKTIRETIKKDLEINELEKDMFSDRNPMLFDSRRNTMVVVHFT